MSLTKSFRNPLLQPHRARHMFGTTRGRGVYVRVHMHVCGCGCDSMPPSFPSLPLTLHPRLLLTLLSPLCCSTHEYRCLLVLVPHPPPCSSDSSSDIRICFKDYMGHAPLPPSPSYRPKKISSSVQTSGEPAYWGRWGRTELYQQVWHFRIYGLDLL